MTLRAQEKIAHCDVIVYDNLVNPKILEFRSPDTELIFVGKEAGRHSVPQAEIQQIILEQARQNKTVVRLKGGDPFIFGRGGEEALELKQAGHPLRGRSRSDSCHRRV